VVDSPAGLVPALAWFSESASRVALAVAPERVAEVAARARAAGVPFADIGVAAGNRLVARDAFDLALVDAATAWRDAIPRLLDRAPVAPA
jgi:phosphoribosylformylglycinamidine synthase subunit PurL